ncbi:MAG: HD domain-containing protein [Oscillospiraceae bacterium]|nr:HD domain-containing protein [Oscillospiraceae bacterium]
MANDREMAQKIALRVREAGGTAYYVGGYVRDTLLGLDCKDIDLEIHGIPPEMLLEVLSSLGEPDCFGESFGIFRLRHYSLDIAMPRSERAVGAGHKDFLCSLDPCIGTRQAAIRRDFTVNALMQDVLSGEIIDPFGGRKDLENHLLRHMDSRRFAEDPLRVLRAAQFAARFEFRIAPETLILCGEMDLSTLPGERVFSEMEKALLKSSRPSIFWDTLRSMGQLGVWFPELQDLIAVPQSPKYHPEGDVWTHTMLVLNHAAALRGRTEQPLSLMLSALCHDFGKSTSTSVTEDGAIHAIGHEIAGLPLAERFLRRMTRDRKLIRTVLNMTELHMRPNMYVAQGAGFKSYNRVFDMSVSPADLLLLCRADALGSGCDPAVYAKTEEELHRHLQDYRTLMSRPGVSGQDLVDAGFHPGPHFHAALDYAHKLQLSGVDRKSALAQTLAFLRRAESESNNRV